MYRPLQKRSVAKTCLFGKNQVPTPSRRSRGEKEKEKKREEKERQYQGNEYSQDTKKGQQSPTCRKPAPWPGTPRPPKTQFKKKKERKGKGRTPQKPHPHIRVQTNGKVCRSHLPQRPTPIETRERRNSISPPMPRIQLTPKNSKETPRREKKTVQPQRVAQSSPNTPQSQSPILAFHRRHRNSMNKS